MPVTLQREAANTFRLDVSGVLRKADLDRAQERLVAEMRGGATASPRLLVVLKGFEGWESNPRWDDLTFFISHGDAIAKIALVGDERWRDEALMFAAADLRKAPVEFFAPEALADARAWLSA
jgi:hypothetical protein